MQGVLKSHQLARVLRRCSSPILFYSLSPLQSYCNSSLWRRHFTSGMVYGNYMQTECNLQRYVCQCQKCSMMLRASFSTEAGTVESGATESVKELYDKMLKSVVDQRSAPPNAWLWSLIQSCANHEDANLLFDILQRLRIFRLSNLRIHENFNCALCQEITKACIRVGAIDLGKKVLWKHSVYGLTPNVGSAHHLLLFAKQHNDVKLLVEIMNLVKKNDLILQPGTADIVFRMVDIQIVVKHDISINVVLYKGHAVTGLWYAWACIPLDNVLIANVNTALQRRFNFLFGDVAVLLKVLNARFKRKATACCF